jgi:hypothetical protein
MKMWIMELKADWCSRFGEGAKGRNKNYNKGMPVFDRGQSETELHSSFEDASVICF